MDSIDDSSPIARELAHENKRRERLIGRQLPKPEKTRVWRRLRRLARVRRRRPEAA